MAKVELIIFDCDGVLVDSELISCRVFTEMIRELGVEISEHRVYQDLVGGSMAKSIAYVEKLIGKPLEKSFFTNDYRQRSFEAYKKEMKPVEGIIELITSLTIPYCVGSNGPKDKIRLNLGITGLDQYFKDDHIFSAYDIKKWKPAPDLFLHAATVMGAVPKSCLVIEDSRNGIMAAINAKMHCLGYCPEGDQRFAGLDVQIIQSMSEVSSFL